MHSLNSCDFDIGPRCIANSSHASHPPRNQSLKIQLEDILDFRWVEPVYGVILHTIQRCAEAKHPALLRIWKETIFRLIVLHTSSKLQNAQLSLIFNPYSNMNTYIKALAFSKHKPSISFSGNLNSHSCTAVLRTHHPRLTLLYERVRTPHPLSHRFLPASHTLLKSHPALSIRPILSQPWRASIETIGSPTPVRHSYPKYLKWPQCSIRTRWGQEKPAVPVL